MLGEIIKSTEALRYHAKTAEIAGQNLAHVNDESYARQRVLAKDGLMNKSQGGLSTSSLEGAGLDHARNDLLDKRVFSELGESASLEAQIDILNLLQAAIGETVNRAGIDGGLDLEHDSNLAEGGLARALDDLFNAFQELSASPDETNAKQEIFQKIQTLTKRFNDAGNALDEIETDISNAVESSVTQVNRLLDQIYEVNLQIKRFELLGQGKAVTYRDNRQGLLEDLSKLINFRTDPELSENGDNETGFLNLLVQGSNGENIEILTSTNGVKQISKDFGKVLQLENQDGNGAKIRAKIASDGSLGHIEVLDGGSQYDDSKGPILVSFAPTENISSIEEGKAVLDHKKGDVFRQDGQLYQALYDTLAGATLDDDSNFLSVSTLPPNGEVFNETLRRYSDLDNFDKGELVFYEGKLYQTTNKFGATGQLGVDTDSPTKILQDIAKGEVVELNGNYFQAKTNVKGGTSIQGLDAQDFEVGEDVDGKLLALGNVPPAKVEELSYVIQSITDDGVDRWFLGKSYQEGDIVKFEDKFFEVTQDIYRETEVADLASVLQNDTAYSIGDQFGSFMAIESPSPDFLEENGSIYLSSNKKEFTISDLTGSLQTKEIKVEQIPNPFEFSLSVAGEEFTLSQSLDGDLADQISEIKNAKDQTLFNVTKNDDGSILISGLPGVSDDFVLTENSATNSAVISTERVYLADKFFFTIQETGTRFDSPDETPISVDLELDFQGSKSATNQALVDRINNHADLSKIVTAEIKNGAVSITSLKDIGTSYDLEFLQGFSDDHELQLSTQINELEILEVTPPDVTVAQVLAINGFEGTESFPTEYEFTLNDNLNDFELNISDQKIVIPVDQNLTGLERLESIETKLLEIELDGSFIDGQPAQNPAFEITLTEPDTFSILGKEETGTFSIPTQVGLTKKSSDRYDITIDGLTLSVPSNGDEQATAEAIADAINSQPTFVGLVTASTKLNDNQSWDLILTSQNTDVSVRENISVSFKNSVADLASLNAQSATITAKGSNDIISVVTSRATSLDFKRSVDTSNMSEKTVRFKQNEIYYQADTTSPTGYSHFVVTAPVDISIDDMAGFDPKTDPWRGNFQSFKADLLDPADPSTIVRKSYPTGHNLENGNLVEVNIGLGEAVVKGGQIAGFNILNSGNGLPLTDSVFVDGNQLKLESGAIKGYQNSRSQDVENFRERLNQLVSTFVEEINAVYNPEDQPGSYLFGFDAVLTRPVTGRNLLMEEEFGYKGREGDAFITLYRDEVDMTLPFASTEDFSIVNTTPIYSEDFRGVDTVNFFRGGDVAETTFRADDAGDLFSFYASASRMNYVTMENDDSYPGADLSPGTEDDGRSLMMAYETIPFRIEGLEEGSKLPIIGDNFTFSALPSNPWNLASSLRVDRRLTSDSLLAGSGISSGSNERAQAIAELGDGTFIDRVASLNAELGSSLGDLNDNLDHQKSIETLLLDQRRAVSSVSIDEEVADLMRFQRSFQASSRVLTTLDKMLEIIVMGLVR
jgi:flagellar hook-associated protein FlgK